MSRLFLSSPPSGPCRKSVHGSTSSPRTNHGGLRPNLEGMRGLARANFKRGSFMEKGLVQVYTGNGKGKTTAALGVALRAVGHGMKVLVIQFMKGDTGYGEQETARKLSPNLTILKAGREGFVSRSNPEPIDFKLAQEGYSMARKAIQDKGYDIVILDEINMAIDYGLLPLSDLLQW